MAAAVAGVRQTQTPSSSRRLCVGRWVRSSSSTSATVSGRGVRRRCRRAGSVRRGRLHTVVGAPRAARLGGELAARPPRFSSSSSSQSPRRTSELTRLSRRRTSSALAQRTSGTARARATACRGGDRMARSGAGRRHTRAVGGRRRGETSSAVSRLQLAGLRDEPLGRSSRSRGRRRRSRSPPLPG